MNNILMHYGVKGMEWGVRKQYEGTGGGGGGGWGPNTIAGGGGPSPLAASMAGNPKKKALFGKSAADKMGIADNKKERAIKEKKKAQEDIVNILSDYNTAMNSMDYKSYNKSEKKLNKYLESYFKKYGNDSIANLDSHTINDGSTAFELTFKDDDYGYVIWNDYIVKVDHSK